MAKTLPRYPIYIPSKGRHEDNKALTARFLEKDGVPFYLVVEPQERAAYEARFGSARVLTLPWDNPGSVIPARNWIKDHSISIGAARHWQFDDNMRRIARRYKGRRLPCDSGIALRACEDFVERYENIAIAGLNYEMFAPDGQEIAPFYLNVHVYSCTLFLNSLPHRWRGRYNEDTDICLQVLADGWCTLLFNAFLVAKVWTMKLTGGNTTTLYQGDGRLRMARSLERLWPGVVETKRRFQRPQHVVKDSWKCFTTPLKLKAGVDLSAMPAVDEKGMRLTPTKEVRSQAIRKMAEEHRARHGR